MVSCSANLAYGTYSNIGRFELWCSFYKNKGPNKGGPSQFLERDYILISICKIIESKMLYKRQGKALNSSKYHISFLSEKLIVSTTKGIFWVSSAPVTKGEIGRVLKKSEMWK